jgi:HK97 gp10 family phage protein|tara:strand:+ start:2962 stop:3423 length:462 start_codon:yes stop_codon:yes gene_type:complete
MELNAGKVIGQKALLRAMYKIPYEVKRNKFFMAVFRQAAKPIIQAARANINNDEGDLRRSIKAFSTRASRRLPAMYVGPKATGGRSKENKQRGGGFYGAMVEYGTVHSSPHPFMRPAWEQKQNQSKEILLQGAKLIVEKVIKRELAGQKRLYV